MLIPDRRSRILAEVRRTGSASVPGLASLLGISAWTVRRDLDVLEADGLLRRTRGGALLAGSDARSAAAVPATDAKRRIGRAAAELVPDGSTILLLGGSTTAAVVECLHERTLTVVTNGLDVAQSLRHSAGITLVVLGGYLHRDQMTLLGPMTDAAMGGLHVDTIIGGAWGVDAERGVTGNKIIQAGPHHAMLNHADRLVVVADATKIGRRGPTVLAPIEHVSLLVTDTDAPPDALDRIRDRDVQVMTV